MNSIFTTITLIPETCCVCGVSFGMPSDYKEKRLQDHKEWYCPNGHSQHYVGKTDAQILREERERFERELGGMKSSRDYYQEKFHNEQNSKAAVKGHLTRTRNRIKSGVCPGCNRTFGNLAAHMKTQHPKFQ